MMIGKQEYDLIADLHVEAADAAFLSGDFAEMEDLIDRLLEKKLQIRHEVRIHQIQIQALAARDRQAEAVDIALNVLERLGVPFPTDPKDEDVGSGS